jgi:hypothetical protein
MEEYKLLGWWKEKYQHHYKIFSNSPVMDIKYKIENIRYFPELLDGSKVIVYGDYDIILCLITVENGYEPKYLKIPFSKEISIIPLVINESDFKNIDFKIKFSAGPNISISKPELKRELVELLGITKNKVFLNITGELHLEVFKKNPYESNNYSLQAGNKGETIMEGRIYKDNSEVKLSKPVNVEKKKSNRDFTSVMKDYHIYNVNSKVSTKTHATNIQDNNRSKVLNGDNSFHKVQINEKLNLNEGEYERIKENARKNSQGK